MIQAHQLSKTFKQGQHIINALDNVDLEIKAGETMAILGPSGSGKTTLLSLLAGLESPSSGCVQFSDTVISQFTEKQLSHFRSHEIGIVFQHFYLIPHLTALENVSLATEIAGIPNPEKVSTEFLAHVGLENRMGHLPSQLSGGEQQRVAIARAFAKEPKIVFADEPSGNLDQETGDLIINTIFQQTERTKGTLVVVTHDLRLAQKCQRIVKIQNGKLVN